MTTIITQYPSFEANQVLTSEHLNQLFEYLDTQNRITRTHLIGVGIVCGLELNQTGTSISISKGCGVTSEGYVISEPVDVNLVSYKTYTLPQHVEYSHFKDSDAPYAPLDLLELLPAGEPGTMALTTSVLANKVVLLFLELRKDSLRNCSVNNCDDKGAEVSATVRRLLISKSQLDAVIDRLHKLNASLASTTDLESNLLARLNLADLVLPRVDVVSTELKSANQIIQAFRSALNTSGLINQLRSALEAANVAFKPLLGNINIDVAKARLTAINTEVSSSSKITHLQNYYDFVDDLIKAYDEFRWTGLDLICSCHPAEQLFPRHLMLGTLSTSGVANPLIYRNRFLPSPVVHSCEDQRVGLAQLFKRMIRMIESFNSQPALHMFAEAVTDKEISITPTKLGDVALSQKAIPYYYQNVSGTTPLYQLWNPSRTRRNRAQQNLSYRSFDYSSVPVSVLAPLKYDLEPYNFLRIEGHLNKAKQAVMQTLAAYKAKYRLPIEIVALETGEVRSKSPNQVYFDTLKGFLAQHPGLQHKAGVPMGGTFILVCHGNSDSEAIAGGGSLSKDTVIADFYLPYPVLPKVEVTGQRLVKECEYAWIDSVKHLNNIMLRAYRLTETGKAPAAAELEKTKLSTNYVVRVYKYEIQGVDVLKDSYAEISIPITTLKAQRLNALTAALNERFPKGAVFDCRHNSNQFVIRYLEGHEFRIELGGLQGNQIRYAFTNEGVSRWQHKAWQPMSSTHSCSHSCKVIAGKYDEKDYEWLHINYPATSRNVLPLPSAKEVIRWEQQTLLRARQYDTVKELPIYHNVLATIAADILLIDATAKLVLVGSWANGSWLSRDELVNEEGVAVLAFAQESGADTLERFVDLRKKVTGKAGVSDIDILIESNHQITPDMLQATVGYKVNLIKGRADEQKGMRIDTRRDA